MSADVKQLIEMAPLRAAAFIVTIYGDVIAPRGGEVAVGNLIDLCAQVGISQTLVRTAVSRLVAAGQLTARREGRRSFYRLTAQAAEEYDRAAKRIYGPAPQSDWRFLFLSEAQAEALMPTLERQGYARLRPQLAAGPDHLPLPEGALVFDARAAGDLRGFCAAFWDLSALAADYRAFMAAVPQGGGLVARLLMVHRFRKLVLRDPGLPLAGLPADWPGLAARRAHAGAYLALSPLAEAEVAATLESATGPLPAQSDASRARAVALEHLVSQKNVE